MIITRKQATKLCTNHMNHSYISVTWGDLGKSVQLPRPSESQACHAEGPGFAPGTLQGVLFPVAAHHTTLGWQWARDWGALFTYHLGAGRPLVAGDK